MNVTFECRHCERPVRMELSPASSELLCPACGKASSVTADDFADDGKLQACVICGCRELFVRKDFPQRLGVSIVVCGVITSSIALGFHQRFASYAILFATAFIDLVLYFMVKNMLECYRCHAVYRDLRGLDEFEPFKLETHEKFRQQSIRLAQNKK